MQRTVSKRHSESQRLAMALATDNSQQIASGAMAAATAAAAAASATADALFRAPLLIFPEFGV
jgi:hypothetical protein